ncbi:MAG: aspartate 1-decarboxylase [Flammeovirgaceae bacterium]|nr:MAG: aspartate 1-decarboxylase [Flammeovirgaceae bacterium]
MMRTMLKSKIHRAVVTGSDLNYEGSIAIDTELCKAADMLEFEKVEIYNINNGARFSTYVIPGRRGEISLNGAAARMVQPGDLIIIASYVNLPDDVAKKITPKIVMVDESNTLLPEPVSVP